MIAILHLLLPILLILLSVVHPLDTLKSLTDRYQFVEQNFPGAYHKLNVAKYLLVSHIQKATSL